MIIKHNKILNTGKVLLLVALVLVAFGCVPGAASVAKGWSGAAIDGTTLYIGSMDGKILSVNTADGKMVWEAPLEATAAPSGGFGCSAPPAAVAIYGSPAVSGNLVYLGGYNGKFYAFAPGEQEPRWVYPREGLSMTQIVGGAIVADGKVFFGTAGGKVYALNAATGSSANGWVFPADDSQIGKIWSAPTVLDGTLFVGSFDRNLYALDIATGQKKWAFPTQGSIVASPVTDNDTVYIGSFDRNIYAVNAATGQQKWRFTGAKNWFWAQLLVDNGKIYAANLDGKVYVLDAKNGSKLAELDLGGALSASPVMVGSAVMAANENGVVYSLNTGTNEKRLLLDLKEKVDAPLATDGTAVFIHTSTGKLYAVNVQTGVISWTTLLKN
ncbi:MAG: PQQ-binding-like beta-propeller repeat protein [Dehalococcoidales bacterium]|nr:PQQ-binding-like beta-propeller repeat protein [Dehalococcoidales bacterium]